MQTFLPYRDFHRSATCIDKKRCWKQVVEAAQIIDVLEGKKTGWANHPAVKMWVGHTDCLKEYFNAFLCAAKEKYKVNTKYEYFNIPTEYSEPWWLGNEDFHRAMRARLIEKDFDYYEPLFYKDDHFNEGKYLWPVMETQTFRTI